MARLLGLGTALPARRYAQEEIHARCEASFAAARGRAALFARAGVETRALAEAPDYYFQGLSFERRNADYFRHALDLSRRALEAALAEAQTGYADVSHLFSVTTTGLLTPSLEAHLAQSLPFRRTVKRTPIFGVGCAGGAVGLSRACEYLRGHPEETVAVLATELCSLSFLPQEGGMTQLVAAALFGDGAACAVLCGPRAPGAARARAEFVDEESRLLPDSLGVMGWEFGSHGMRLLLSPEAPRVVEREARGALTPLLERHGLTPAMLGTLALHPGSGRILDACEAALSLPPGSTAASRDFLRENGNLSSASVLFVLRAALARPARGGSPWGLLAAFGPGFASEALLFKRP